MSTARHLRLGILAAALATGFAITVAAPAANATVSVNNCTFSFGPTRLAADCYDNDNSAWYLRIACEDARGHDHMVNGQLRNGSGISIAQCPVNTTLGNGATIVNL
jgi:hypothetical protein